ncbi:MAG: aminotransferase class V-fold PLP-dependent enzyme [Nocardioidaceae bacterium]
MQTPEEFRRRFPSLTDTVHLASCSQGALSDTLATALLEFQYTMREYGAPWSRWMEEVDTARALFAGMIGADVDDVAVVSCASAAAFQVASTQDWRHRPCIVTTEMEFPSVAHVWLAQQPSGAKVVYAADHDGLLDAADYEAVIDESCGLVSVPLISYRNGSRLPAKQVISAARAAGARTFVDAYQGAGVEPIDVRELDCDYLTSGTLKYMLGIPGIAFLYVRGGLADTIPPAQTGWFGRGNPFGFDPRHIDYPAHARRFETGTPSIPSAFGAVAGMRVLATLDPAAVQGHIAKLGQQLQDRLVADGERLWSPTNPQQRGPQVAVIDACPEELAGYLASRRIVTSPRGGLLRLSLHYYNTAEDIDAVIGAIRNYRNRSTANG